MPKMSIPEIQSFVSEVFPQSRWPIEIDDLQDGFIRMRVGVSRRHLRPGNTVSGPALMAIADTAMYLSLIHI